MKHFAELGSQCSWHMAGRKGRIIKPVSVLVDLIAVYLLARQELFIYSSCARYQTASTHPRKHMCPVRNRIVPQRTKKIILMTSQSPSVWDTSLIGMVGGR